MTPEEEGGMERSGPDGSTGAGDGRVRVVLLGSGEDWFASALRSVLEPEGFVILRAASADEILSHVRETVPDLVILDDGLPPLDAPELMRRLIDGPLANHVPVLFHVSRGGVAGRGVRMLEAGAWGLLADPVRPAPLVAQLDRFLQIGRIVAERSDEERYVDRETDMSTLSGLSRLLPAVTDLARRRDVPISCAAIGPTEPGSGEALERQRRSMAELCRRHVRRSDFVGWLHEGSDFAVVAFGTSRSGAEEMARRLGDVSEGRSAGEEPGFTLSAGILEMEPRGEAAAARRRGSGSGPSHEIETGIEGLHALAAARTALREARDAGGGIRFVEGM